MNRAIPTQREIEARRPIGELRERVILLENARRLEARASELEAGDDWPKADRLWKAAARQYDFIGMAAEARRCREYTS